MFKEDEAGGQAQMVDAFLMFMLQPNSRPHINKSEFSGQAKKNWSGTDEQGNVAARSKLWCLPCFDGAL